MIARKVRRLPFSLIHKACLFPPISKNLENKMAEKYEWHKQTMAEDCKTIHCKPHDPIKDFNMEATGHYVLIRPNKNDMKIEVAICDKDHKIVRIFIGSTCQEIYNAIFKDEEESGVVFFKNKEHIAYLGKELKKCELALTEPNAIYYQE